MNITTELQQTINDMVDSTRGILAVDESSPTIAKRFAAINVESTQENRCHYRPEVLMDGNHDIDRCAEVTENVLHSVFHALHKHHVSLELMVLKPNMIVPGGDLRTADPQEVAGETLKVLRRTVPAAVPSINFLSGGQGPEEATRNLNAINQLGGNNAPWQLSISYGRALQQPALFAWQGKTENDVATQQALLTRARLNSLARQGKYEGG